MSNLNTHGVTDYASAMRFLDGKYERTLCYATTLVDAGVCVTVRHHDTAIITYWANGLIEIRNDGWLSKTTTDRLHRMTPSGVRVSFAKGGSVESPKYTGSQPYAWTAVL